MDDNEKSIQKERKLSFLILYAILGYLVVSIVWGILGGYS
ncbi:hypothetical protein phiOC_p389 [Ochrobactrum phage vB_OspM_OC]|nr:hypothetical protein phiOC_p389 [Ochrobactrum phage vB_OspM_OC]